MIEFLLASLLFIAPDSVNKIDSTVNAITTKTISSKQFACMSNAVFHEAGNQSLEGKIAVASVILNRAKSSRFPDSPCDVVYQKNQFSFVAEIKTEKGRIKREAHRKAISLVKKRIQIEHKKISTKLFRAEVAKSEALIFRDELSKAFKKNHLDKIAFKQSKVAVWLASKLDGYIDLTNGSLFYYAPKGVKSEPKWVSVASSSITIGDHVFLRGVE